MGSYGKSRGGCQNFSPLTVFLGEMVLTVLEPKLKKKLLRSSAVILEKQRILRQERPMQLSITRHLACESLL